MMASGRAARVSSSSSRATTRAMTMDDVDRSIDGRDGRDRDDDDAMDDDGPRPDGRRRSRRSIDRWTTIASIASIGSPPSSSSSNGAGGHEIWSVPIVGLGRLSGRRRRDARTGGGGRARGEWTNDAWGGRSWTRSVGEGGRGDARERETRRGIGDARDARRRDE